MSVCLSVTFVDSVKKNQHIFTIFHHRVATLFLFYHTKHHGNIPTGTPLTGASNAGGVGTIAMNKCLALLRAVNGSTAKFNTHSCGRPWQVDDTSR